MQWEDGEKLVDLSGFVTEPLAIIVACVPRGKRPQVARGYAAQLSPDSREMTLHVPYFYPAQLEEAGAERPAIAVVLSRVSDFETYQFKGDNLVFGAKCDATEPRMDSYLQGFRQAIVAVGMSNECADGLIYSSYISLTFSIRSAFRQTPGPGAGRELSLAVEPVLSRGNS